MPQEQPDSASISPRVMPTGLLGLWSAPPAKPQQEPGRGLTGPGEDSGEHPLHPQARWSVSNHPVTHDSLSSPEQAVTMTGYTGRHGGGGSSQPTTTSRTRTEGTCPYSSSGWFWLQAWVRPSHQLTQHSKSCLWPQLPFAVPWSLAVSPLGPHSTTWVEVARAALLAGLHLESDGGSGPFQAITPVQHDQQQGPRHVSRILCVRMIAQHSELGEQPS